MDGAGVSPSRRYSVLIRTLGWGGYAILVSAAAVLGSLGVSDAAVVQLGDGLLYLVPITLALLCAAWLGVTTHHGERRLWFLIAAISALVLCSEVYFTWYSTVIDPHGPTMPAPYQLLQLLAVILGIGVFATMTSFGSAPLRSILRFALDASAGMIVLAAACYWFFILPLFRSAPSETWQGAAVAALYPAVGLTIVAFMCAASFGWRTYRWRSWEQLITGAFLLYGAGLIVSPIAYIQMKTVPDPHASFWATAALGFGYYVLFMAIVYRATTSVAETGVEPWFFPRLGPRWLPTVYPILLAAAMPVLGASALLIGGNPEGIPITLAAVGLGAVLVLRSWLFSSETVLHRRLATTDEVTGARNYRYLRQRLSADLAYAQSVGAQLAVITIGVAGSETTQPVRHQSEWDRVMAAVAGALRDAPQGDTSLCRTGGDVFVLIARGCGAKEAVELSGNLLSRAIGSIESRGMDAALSAGIAMFPAHGNAVDDLVARSGGAQAVAASEDPLGVVVYGKKLEPESGPASRMTVARARSRRATTRVLATAVDARNPETRRHSENVADLVSALSLMLDLPSEQAHVLDLAAQMHDVGKIGVPDAVLQADGPLSKEQRQQVELHPVLGERILASARLDEILPAVRHHHERWDGQGYPDGLSGHGIPLEARVLAVCDAYESMTTPHVYNDCLSTEQAIAEIDRCAGTQFDPAIAAPFCRMIRQIHGASPRDRAGRGPKRPE